MRKRLLIIVSAAAISCAVFFASNAVGAASLQSRIWGNDRYETNFKIVDSGWTSSEYAVIASGEGFADVLCAAPLAKQYNAPILLTEKYNLSSGAQKQLSNLKVKNVFIIGGTGVVSDNVKSKLENMNIKTTRICGKDRFETAVKVAKNLKSSTGVVVTNGYGFADALSIAPIAAQKGMAILLTDKEDLSLPVKNFLDSKSYTESYVVGGTGVVNDKIASQLKNNTRLGGNSRYATNSAILNHFADKFNYDKVYVASGENYPDALSGSVLAASSNSPLILVGTSVDSSVMSSVKDQHDKYKSVIVLGGSGVVSEESANSIVQGIEYLNDSEAVTLINNADKLGYPVVEANHMPVIHTKDGKYYQRLEDKFNSKEKLFSYLNEYYTELGSNRIMNMLELREIDGAYCKKVGQLGCYPPDILNAKVVSKTSSNNRMEVVIAAKDLSDGSIDQYKAVFMYESGKWLVNYWQGLMVK
ncbi:cell wall-binding repeat-containing protein [Clostridium sp. P21]|uniref:Cell wall-binding repeat-containing protein n=1 Tax=Clostridium muellerianum TaxID=2716538 RepID=A0A7Y0EG96_9CLOT|nr:cell wall-binding repeat-containing protein [Clostridium muellerianum]NMM62841.1 cell wall-binding repeat-containing protein [Clostridium muellerianum]